MKRIIINPSAKLIVNGVVDYDNSDPNVPDLYKKFKGIRVEGIPNVRPPGVGALFSGYPWGNSNTNGILIVEGGEIYNGFTSIESHDGGIVYIDNSILSGYRNAGIIFAHQNPLSLNSLPTLAVIKNSEFVNSPYLDEAYEDWGTTAINATNFHGISVYNCNFYNMITHPDAGTAGIYAFQTGINIDKCNFEDLEYGVFTGAFFGSVRGYLNIRDCKFESCENSILLRGLEITQIRNNTFNCPNSGVSIGIKVDRSTGFDIKENKFNNYGTSFLAQGNLSKAITIESSGDNGNVIRKNIFNNCRGVFMLEDNRGLQLKCNEFFTTLSSSLNFYSTVNNLSIPINKRGLSDQGALFTNDVNGVYLPGNIFSQSCNFTMPQECDFSIFAPHSTFKYYYFNSLGGINPTFPLYRNDVFIKATESNIANYSKRANTCSISDLSFSEVIDRKDIALNLMNSLNPLSENDTTIGNIDYLKGHIQTLNIQALMLILEENNDTVLYDFLKFEGSVQSKLWLAELYIDDGLFDSSVAILNQITIEDEDSYFFMNKSFLLKMASHFANEGDLSNFNTDDFESFQLLSNKYTAVSYRASNLLMKINECAESLTSLVDIANQANTVNHKILISPNPAINSISLLRSFNGFEFQILTINGQVLLKDIYNGSEIDISNLNSGLYQLILKDGEGNLRTQKFVKLNQ